ncbi:MAG: hypothetical protein Q9P44_14670 [Anaerolineae bacterium]|nr:hypothetical protein [Anaerolineae bacterium]
MPALAVGYYIGCGNDAAALDASDKALDVARQSGNLARMFEWHIARGYLLNRLKRSTNDEMAQAKILLQAFRTSDCHMKKIQRIEQGLPYPYDWQIEERKNH